MASIKSMNKVFDMKIFSKFAVFLLVVAFIASLAGSAKAAPTTVGLGTTAPFAVLAGTGITNVPTSAITGNVGLSPATGAAITGLTCAEVTGTIYDVDGAFAGACETTDAPLLTTAKNDLVTAYDDAAGRTPTTVPTELGGTTLTPGVYNSASTTFGITAGSGPLILDAQGDPDGVFIFQMDSGATGLTVGPSSVVQLTGGAQACNVFWKLNTASIDTNATFKGTILALTSITVANGANIEGRLLARNGNVTLISNTITKPTCAAATTPTSSTSTPGLPSTEVGSNAQSGGLPWHIIVPTGIIITLAILYLARKKQVI